LYNIVMSHASIGDEELTNTRFLELSDFNPEISLGMITTYVWLPLTFIDMNPIIIRVSESIGPLAIRPTTGTCN
jgi:hypothetical protein